jgi:hypothetical protein
MLDDSLSLLLWLHHCLLLLSKRSGNLLHERGLNLPGGASIWHHDRSILVLDRCEEAVGILPEWLLSLLLNRGLLLDILGLTHGLLHHWHPDELLLRLSLNWHLHILNVLWLRLLKLRHEIIVLALR